MRTLCRGTSGFLAWVAVLVLASPGVGQDGGSVRLRLHLKPGQSYLQSNSTEMVIAQTVMGQEQQSRQSNTMVALNEVLSVDARGVARVRVTYESIRVLQEGPMGRAEYDSADPAGVPPQALRPYAFLVGRSFTMDLAPDGSIGAVEGMDELLTGMIADMDLPAGPMRDQVVGMLEDRFDGGAMQEMMGQALAAFPDEPVAVGESWTHSSRVTGPVPVALETTWTLRERRGGIAYLDVRVTTRNDGTMEMGPMVMSYDLTGEMTGTAEVDEATGLTLRSRMEGEDTGTVTLSGGPMGAQSMPMTTRSVIAGEIVPRGP